MRAVSPLSAGVLAVVGSSHYRPDLLQGFGYYLSRVLDGPSALADVCASLNPARALRDFHAHRNVQKASASPMSSMKLDEDAFTLPWVTLANRKKAEALASTRFEEGSYWVWMYRDPSGQPHSWERYSVCESSPNGEITIEMSSRFNKDEKYSTHHRMELSLGECLASRLYHKAWRLHKFSFQKDGEWCEAPFNENVQAFEEKFDVFLMDTDLPIAADRVTHTKTQYVEGFGNFAASQLVQTVRHGYTNAWYAHHAHQHAGLAAFKEFMDEQEENGNYYTFELIEVGNNSPFRSNRD